MFIFAQKVNSPWYQSKGKTKQSHILYYYSFFCKNIFYCVNRSEHCLLLEHIRTILLICENNYIKMFNTLVTLFNLCDVTHHLQCFIRHNLFILLKINLFMSQHEFLTNPFLKYISAKIDIDISIKKYIDIHIRRNVNLHLLMNSLQELSVRSSQIGDFFSRRNGNGGKFFP